MENIDSIMLSQIKDIDQRDEGQIMAELAGETLQEYFYEVIRYDRRQRKQIRKVKLSWVGVREVARNRGNILLDEPQITETENHWRIVVKATDLTRNFTVFGGCHQLKKMKMSDIDERTGEVIGDKIVEDDYSFEKALSKAQRNALDKCVPGDYMAKAIDKLLRASGRPLLHQAEPKKERGTKKEAETKQLLPSSEVKPKSEWENITKEMVPDFPKLEPIIWDLCKLQPREMYQQLGVSSKADFVDSKITAWDAFLQLKELFSPQDEGT